MSLPMGTVPGHGVSWDMGCEFEMHWDNLEWKTHI